MSFQEANHLIYEESVSVDKETIVILVRLVCRILKTVTISRVVPYLKFASSTDIQSALNELEEQKFIEKISESSYKWLLDRYPDSRHLIQEETEKLRDLTTIFYEARKNRLSRTLESRNDAGFYSFNSDSDKNSTPETSPKLQKETNEEDTRKFDKMGNGEEMDRIEDGRTVVSSVDGGGSSQDESEANIGFMEQSESVITGSCHKNVESFNQRENGSESVNESANTGVHKLIVQSRENGTTSMTLQEPIEESGVMRQARINFGEPLKIYGEVGRANDHKFHQTERNLPKENIFGGRPSVSSEETTSACKTTQTSEDFSGEEKTRSLTQCEHSIHRTENPMRENHVGGTPTGGHRQNLGNELIQHPKQVPTLAERISKSEAIKDERDTVAPPGCTSFGTDHLRRALDSCIIKSPLMSVPAATAYRQTEKKNSPYKWTNKAPKIAQPIETLELYCKLKKFKSPSYDTVHVAKDDVHYCLLTVGDDLFKSHPAQAKSALRAMEICSEIAIRKLGITEEMLRQMH